MKRDYLFGEPRETVRSIAREVAHREGLSVADLYGPSRRARLVKARHAAMYIAHKKGGHSLSKVGRIFGNRDHTTVMNAVRKVEAAPHEYPIV